MAHHKLTARIRILFGAAGQVTAEQLFSAHRSTRSLIRDRFDKLEERMTAADERIETALAGIRGDYGTYQGKVDALQAAYDAAIAELATKDADAAAAIEAAVADARAEAEAAKSGVADQLEAIDALVPDAAAPVDPNPPVEEENLGGGDEPADPGTGEVPDEENPGAGVPTDPAVSPVEPDQANPVEVPVDTAPEARGKKA